MEKAKGVVSLRKKKTVTVTTTRPKISAPQLISSTSANKIPTTSINRSSTSINSSSTSINRTNTQSPPSSINRTNTQSSDPAPAPTLRAPNWDGSGPTKLADASLTVPQPRPRPSISGGTDRTADLVKRRYSTRFAQPDNDFSSPIPGVPMLPAKYATSVRSARSNRSPERPPGQRLRVDVNALGDPNLLPDKYVARALADATEHDIVNFQSDLQNLKHHTEVDLQHNVYQNRTQFIKISNEAEKLKSEMRTLRTLMSELTSVLGQTAANGTADTQANSRAAKRANRSSVANLEALWSSHLHTLWKRVEGSQKYLPAVPGRHVVHESGQWVELNAATWKPRRRVHLILLNDHLLFASQKKRVDPNGISPNPNANRNHPVQPPTQTHLVAERCWPLQDIQMADISIRPGDSYARSEKASFSHAVNVRVGTESWTFAATSSNSSADTAALLVAYRKASEDLRKTMAAEHGERERVLDELAFLTGDSRLLDKANTTEGIDAGVVNRATTLIDVDGKQQSIRWVETQIDHLDLDIAMQHFEEAVTRTDKLRKLIRGIKGNVVAQEIINLKIDQRAAKLASMLGRRLRDTNSAASVVKENVGWLVKLGYEEMARIGYLEARKEVLRKRTRQVPFTGSLPPHLTALSYVTFTLILHTFRTFSSSFPATSSSAVVKWAKERIVEFNGSLERQLSSVEPGSVLWRDCVAVVRQQSEVLREVGVDFSALVARGMGGEEGGVAVPVRGGPPVGMAV